MQHYKEVGVYGSVEISVTKVYGAKLLALQGGGGIWISGD